MVGNYKKIPWWRSGTATFAVGEAAWTEHKFLGQGSEEVFRNTTDRPIQIHWIKLTDPYNYYRIESDLQGQILPKLVAGMDLITEDEGYIADYGHVRIPLIVPYRMPFSYTFQMSFAGVAGSDALGKVAHAALRGWDMRNNSPVLMAKEFTFSSTALDFTIVSFDDDRDISLRDIMIHDITVGPKATSDAGSWILNPKEVVVKVTPPASDGNWTFDPYTILSQLTPEWLQSSTSDEVDCIHKPIRPYELGPGDALRVFSAYSNNVVSAFTNTVTLMGTQEVLHVG